MTAGFVRKKRMPLPVEAIARAVEELGYECVGVEHVRENGRHVVRVYIDSLGGIVVKDCETVSRKVNALLDEASLMEERYFFEVSSPGIERSLLSRRDYERFSGKTAELSVRREDTKTVKMRGTLAGVTEAGVLLDEENGGRAVISFEDIVRAHLVYIPEKKAKPGGRRNSHATGS